MSFSIQRMTDPRVEQIAGESAARTDKVLARMGFAADDPFRVNWMQEAGDSPLVHARILAEGFAEPPVDLVCALLLLRPCVMAGDSDPRWVATKYGSDIYDRLVPLMNFYSVCEKPEDLAVRLKSGPADAKLVMMAQCLFVLHHGVSVLRDNPSAETDYGFDPAGTENLIEACKGANPFLDAEADHYLAEIRKFYPPQTRDVSAGRISPKHNSII